jgi:hypothetical protein
LQDALFAVATLDCPVIFTVIGAVSTWAPAVNFCTFRTTAAPEKSEVPSPRSVKLVTTPNDPGIATSYLKAIILA